MALDFPANPTNGQTYLGYTYSSTTGAWLSNSSSVAPVYMGDVPPTNPTSGNMWFNTTDGTLYLYYYDGNSYQWVEARAPITSDGYYSPNYFINGSLEINQRGFTSSTTADTYGFDRWRWFYSGGTATHTAQTFTPGEISEPTAINFARIVVSGQAATSDRAQIVQQRIEDVRTLSGKIVTMSFWAKAGSGTPSISYEVMQSFGTGGSTLATGSVAAGTAGKKVLTGGTTWTRYSFTFTVPSVVGKTIGPGSWVSFGLWVSAGSDFATRTDSLGVQNNTFDVWGLQLEEGSVATPFRRNANSLQAELTACRWYYQRVGNWTGFADTTTIIAANVQLATPMRPTTLSITKIAGSTLAWRAVNTDSTTTTWTIQNTAVVTTTPAIYSFWTQFASLSGLTAGQTYHARNAYNYDILEVSAEL